jgi:hypothetical protein
VLPDDQLLSKGKVFGGKAEVANEEGSGQEMDRLDDAHGAVPEVAETRQFCSGCRRAPNSATP